MESDNLRRWQKIKLTEFFVVRELDTLILVDVVLSLELTLPSF
jgi:hypothetical protein